MKKAIISDANLVARCVLYCGSCGAYLNDKCLGCAKNEKASWCKIRTCCKENAYDSSTDCTTYQNTSDCKKLNNFISKIFTVIFRFNCNACIKSIKEIGIKNYADKISKDKAQSLKQ